jgi:hypothetical protein
MNCWKIHPISQTWLLLTSVFSKLELFLAGQRFSSNQEAIAVVERNSKDLTKNHYGDGIMALEHRWNKCINLKGDCVKK